MIDHSDLPKLQSITLGEDALEGDWDRKTIDVEPFNYKNTLSMKSNQSICHSINQIFLPSLPSKVETISITLVP